MAKEVAEVVEDAFRFYNDGNFTGHQFHPEIKEYAKLIAEKLVSSGNTIMKDPELAVPIAAFLASERYGGSLNLKRANEYSNKITIGNLYKARNITDIRPKLRPEDWVGGVIEELKINGYIPDSKENVLFEVAISEIPKNGSSPRHRAVSAVYLAMKETDIEIRGDDLKIMFGISCLPPLGRSKEKTDNDKEIVSGKDNNF
jgi:hypothetical protein